jgi:predicted outer membrane repeat protein
MHRLVAIAAIALAAPAAHAATYIVGIGAGCNRSDIQTALDDAIANAPSTVRITRSATWSPQTGLKLAGTSPGIETITIEGGYATCDAVGDYANTTISGADTTDPVLAISGSLDVELRYLTIRDGNNNHVNSSFGGGIYAQGIRNLTLQNTTIQSNRAKYGGGIYADRIRSLILHNTTIQYNHADFGGGIYFSSPSPEESTLDLEENVLIQNNVADTDGGGIYLRSATLNMNSYGSILFGNTADNGYGGGLMISSDYASAIADISSNGVGTLGPIYGNSARFGVGVAIVGAEAFTTTPSVAELRLGNTTIRGNSASTYGGAIYARSFEGGGNAVNIASAARLYHAEITGNIAPYGAAVFLDRQAQAPANGAGARLEIDYPTSFGYSGDYYSRITGNAGPAASNPSPIIMSIQGTVQIGSDPANNAGTLVSGNTGAFIGGSDGCLFYVNNVQVTDNVSPAPIISGACQLIEVNDATIAGNSIGNVNVIAVDSDFVMTRSIVWQPGKTTIGAGTGGHAFDEIVTSESASVAATGALRVLQADPWFIDPAHGDYGLQAASPAVDYAVAINGDDRDALGQTRDVDLPIKANTFGPRDVGALERQTLAPLVLDADFDFSDLRLWTRFNGEWDSTQNATGASGSGSWKFSGSNLSQSRVTLGEQCVHLPGPGYYSLSGWGKRGGTTMAQRDYAILGWEFRRNGTASCNGGDPDRFGELYLGSSSSWTQPAQPATIEVGAQDWTTNSSIVLRLIAQDGGVTSPPAITAWFDGITMDVVSIYDRIFANGFQ